MRLILAPLLLLAAPTFAQNPPPKKPAPAARASGPNLKISFKLRSKELSHEGSFVVQVGAQGNYVDGGEIAHEFDNGPAKAVEFHKRAAIVNCTAALDPDKKKTIRAECQFELSGSIKSQTAGKARDLETLQLQTAFEAEVGKPLALIDEAERSVVVTITPLN